MFALRPVNAIFEPFMGIKDQPSRERLIVLTQRFNDVFNKRKREEDWTPLIIRAALPFNSSLILDAEALWIAGDVARGMPMQQDFDLSDDSHSREQIERMVHRDLGYEDPFVVRLPLTLLDLQDSSDQSIDTEINSIIDELVASEYLRYRDTMMAFRFDPLFGAPSTQQKPNLCFVMAPWSRTDVYQSIIEPTVTENGLACQRADNLLTNRGIMESIWHAICEARLVIADLTTANANVFYELGIAHTVGKEVILIEERPQPGETTKRMFDTISVGAILYDGNPVGGQKLRNELDARIKATLARVLFPENPN